MTNISQKQAVLRHLKSGKSITAVEAVNLYSCYRLSASIEKLRKQGYDIVTHYEKNKRGNGSYARYELRGAKIS